MKNRQPIEYSGNVLDSRNDLTGPSDEGKRTYPKLPNHVPIQQSNRKNME